MRQQEAEKLRALRLRQRARAQHLRQEQQGEEGEEEEEKEEPKPAGLEGEGRRRSLTGVARRTALQDAALAAPGGHLTSWGGNRSCCNALRGEAAILTLCGRGT